VQASFAVFWTITWHKGQLKNNHKANKQNLLNCTLYTMNLHKSCFLHNCWPICGKKMVLSHFNWNGKYFFNTLASGRFRGFLRKKHLNACGFAREFLWSGQHYRQWHAEVWWCPGRLLDWMPPYQILVLISGAGLSWSLLLDVLWRHNMTSYSCLQTKVLGKFVDTTCIIKLRCRSSSRAGRAVKMLRAMETYKKQKNRYQSCLFLFNNNVDLKNNNRNIENHSIWVPE